ncbi:hypothetical protein [Sphingomonas sp. M1-B02]|uniref:hypothetical protein n=1 Tax=Sphingomonas sp. M1-B02 TaxID=3114300 RepID=UPI00223FA426|nr:hypothetical protein [Sphingomonas sp. S6-11]UZK65175.1 hypothetical protein OKW87_11685 [Sphingomonas sp. S6-11]
MSDETLAPEPAGPGFRTNYLIGGLAFLGGIAVAAGAFQLVGDQPPAAVPAPAPSVSAPQAPPTVAPALPASTDIATLSAREQELAARLDALQLRLREVDRSARAASTYATRAEKMMIAVAVRRSIERGLPLGPLEPQLRQAFGEGHGDAVAAVLRGAAEPVTIEDLRLALDTIAPRLVSDPNDSLWGSVRRQLGDLIVLRQADSPSPRAADRLRRARRTLDEGQVEAALAEVAHLPGAASAESWVAAARRYISARDGLIEIERAAIEAVPATPPPAAPPIVEPAPAGT